MTRRLGCLSLLAIGLLWMGVAFGYVAVQPLAVNVTTNTTSTALPAEVADTHNPRVKTFWGQVVCSSGACTQTQAIYGDVDADGANGVLLCTLTLSGTPRAQDVCAGSTAPYRYYYVVTTGTTGTAARGDVYAMY